MIAVIDYGAGNLRSISRAIEVLGSHVEVTSDPDRIAQADRVVLPGVGNAKAAMERLTTSGISEAILDIVDAGVPLLGVCLGMQLLFGDQEEGPTTGLSILPGTAIKLSTDHKVPHMGWNTVTFQEHSALAGWKSDYFYFVHSYVVEPANPQDVAGMTEYGKSFPSIVIRDNVWGTQFHPEKSQAAGLNLIDAWLKS